MALDKNEKIVLEAIKNMLDSDGKLGLDQHDYESDERGYEYLHNHIDDLYRVKCASLIHSTSIAAAFTKVHGFKYLDHPKFGITFEQEMRSMGVPGEEREKAQKYYESVLGEMQKDVWNERDSGYNPELEDVMEQPEQPLDFKIHDQKLMKSNVKWDKGNGSPSRTPKSK